MLGRNVILAGLLLLTGCSRNVDHKGKTPLVGIGQNFLYKEDLQADMPAGISGEDSLRFTHEYIRNWIEDELLYRKAEGNIPDDASVDELVSTYRRSLITHIYQEELINQKLGNTISAEEITRYYNQNSGLFCADEPYIKGLFIKVPANIPNIAKVRSWYKKNSQEAIDMLEKFSIGNAVHYEYFYDRWLPVSHFSVKIPLKAIDSDSDYLSRNRNVEVRDSAFCYFLHVEDFLPKGDQLPIERAEREIKEILINLKRVEFIKQMKKDLYDDASEHNDIIYY